jgi:cell envelope opacity-associated protein A
MHLIKTHAEDTQELLKTFRDKISQLEKTVESLSRNQEILQTAMNSLMDLMKVGPLEAGVKTYRVKAGDSLEKIARAHNTTIKTIKALNNLTKDTIVIDQVLKLPE